MGKNYIPKEAAAIDILNNIKQWVDSPAGREILRRGLITTGTGLGLYGASGLVDPEGKHKGKRAIGSVLGALLAGWKGEEAVKALAQSYKNWSAKRNIATNQAAAVNAAQAKGSVNAMRTRIAPTAGDMQELANQVANQAIYEGRAQERQNDVTAKNMTEGEAREAARQDEEFANRR